MYLSHLRRWYHTNCLARGSAVKDIGMDEVTLHEPLKIGQSCRETNHLTSIHLVKNQGRPITVSYLSEILVPCSSQKKQII